MGILGNLMGRGNPGRGYNNYGRRNEDMYRQYDMMNRGPPLGLNMSMH